MVAMAELMIFVGEWDVHDAHQILLLQRPILQLINLFEHLITAFRAHRNNHAASRRQLISQLESFHISQNGYR